MRYLYAKPAQNYVSGRRVATPRFKQILDLVYPMGHLSNLASSTFRDMPLLPACPTYIGADNVIRTRDLSLTKGLLFL